jgi:hypothetical protein
LLIRYIAAAAAMQKGYLRTPYVMSEQVYVRLIKENIKNETNPVQNPLLWRGVDHDDFMDNYKEFFAAAAATGMLLSSVFMKRAVKSQFAGDQKTLEDFADSVCHAHSRCKNGSKNVKDGRFLTETVRKVTMIWKRTNASETSRSSSTVSSGASHASQDVENEFDNKADDDQCLQESKSALANAIAMFQTSSSSKSLKRTMSTVSITSSCISEDDAHAGAKKQPVKVV